MRKPLTLAAFTLLLSGAAQANGFAPEGYYGSLKLLNSALKADNMELTSPRVSAMVDGPDTQRKTNAAIALGYQFGNGWRAEGEYSFKNNANFDSRWAPFNSATNQLQTSSQRLMLNAYKDLPLGNGISAYGTLGIGVAMIDAEGWQGASNRRFAARSQNNLAYSVGMGLSYALNKHLSFDLGYRYIDMGNIETSFNTFQNRGFVPPNTPVTNARDEQLKAKLVSNEVFLGVRASF
jgi:opacity protein-like surface antigen